MNTGIFAFRKTVDDYRYTPSDADIEDMARQYSKYTYPYCVPDEAELSVFGPRIVLL